MGIGTLSVAAGKKRNLAGGMESDIKPFYVGTDTKHNEGGIYLCEFNTQTGSVTRESITKDIINPTFLVVDKSNNYLYSVSETSTFNGQPTGSVVAYRINQSNGKLERLNDRPSHGTDPCFITTDRSNHYVMLANYSSGSVSVYPIQKDGSLGKASDVVQQHGSSVNPKRQEGPHAHSIVPSPDNRFVLSADLGSDKVMIYRFDSQKGKLKPGEQPFAKVKPGLGPRHILFHPNGKIVYVVCEMGSMVIVFDYDPEHGRLTEKQMISTIPKDFKAFTKAAEIQIGSDGRFLYASNRGNNSIVVYAINQTTGELSVVQFQMKMVNWPRYFTIDPTGRFLLVANRDSNNISVFEVNNETGLISFSGHKVGVPFPVCIHFA